MRSTRRRNLQVMSAAWSGSFPIYLVFQSIRLAATPATLAKRETAKEREREGEGEREAERDPVQPIERSSRSRSELAQISSRNTPEESESRVMATQAGSHVTESSKQRRARSARPSVLSWRCSLQKTHQSVISVRTASLISRPIDSANRLAL